MAGRGEKKPRPGLARVQAQNRPRPRRMPFVLVRMCVCVCMHVCVYVCSAKYSSESSSNSHREVFGGSHFSTLYNTFSECMQASGKAHTHSYMYVCKYIHIYAHAKLC